MIFRLTKLTYGYLRLNVNKFTLRNLSISSSYNGIGNDLKVDDIKLDLPDLPQLNAFSNPTFTELGLNQYTPVGFVQYIFENMHVMGDLPYWGCVLSTMFILKTLLLPVSLKEKKEMMKAMNLIAKTGKVNSDAVNAYKNNDYVLMMGKLTEGENIMEKLRKQFPKVIVPLSIQFCAFITTFTALRGIISAPVNDLKTGGILWFTDLSVADPYYLLPLINSYIIFVLCQGMNVSNKSEFWMRILIGPVMFLFTCKFPALLTLYWVSSNLYAQVFLYLQKNPKIRKKLDIPEMEIQKTETAHSFSTKEYMHMLNEMQDIARKAVEEEKRWKKVNQQDIYKEALEDLERRRTLEKKRNEEYRK